MKLTEVLQRCYLREFSLDQGRLSEMELSFAHHRILLSGGLLLLI